MNNSTPCNFMRKTAQARYDANKDHIRIISDKLAAGTLGASKEEKLSAVLSYLNDNADAIQASLNKFVTINPAMIRMKSLVSLIHPRPEPVLITGPSGTGKELIAKAFLRPPDHPFLSENCAALPENLVESIFFGHRKGAFTGATQDHIGLFQAAGSGVVFLDEIGDMPLALQAKLLRAIQENEIRRVGDTETTEISCRFIAATKYDLEDLVAKHRFRDDLFGRLMTYQLHITGLVDRQEDIREITKSFLPRPEAIDELPPFDDKALAYIYKYNVRAIEAFINRYRLTESYWI